MTLPLPHPPIHPRGWMGLTTSPDVLEKRHISCPCREFNPESSSPYPRHYTDYAIPSLWNMVTRKTLWSQEEDIKHFLAPLCVLPPLGTIYPLHPVCPQHKQDWQEWQNNEIGIDYLYFTRCGLTFPLYSRCPSKIMRTVIDKWEICHRKKISVTNGDWQPSSSLW